MEAGQDQATAVPGCWSELRERRIHATSLRAAEGAAAGHLGARAPATGSVLAVAQFKSSLDRSARQAAWRMIRREEGLDDDV